MPQCLYGGALATKNAREKGAAQEERMQLDGQAIDYIHLAFNDYLKHDDVEPKALREMKYYTFTVQEYQGNVIIEILYNNELMDKELHLSFFGGGAMYVIDKSHSVIVDSVFYK